MNQTTTRRREVKTAPVTHGKCRITHSDAASLDECLDHGAVILVIMPERAPWRDYWVRSIRDGRGRIVGYRLETLVGSAEDAAPVYQIDTSFGGGVRWWACDCPDATYRHRMETGGCKHVNALAASLEAPNQTVDF